MPFTIFEHNILQGSIATQVNYGKIFIHSFTANLLLSVMVKEF